MVSFTRHATLRYAALQMPTSRTVAVFCQRVYRFSYDVSGCRGDKGSREVGSVGRMRGGKAGTPQEAGRGRRTRPHRFDDAMDLGLAPVMGAEHVAVGRFRLGNRACLSL